MVELSLDLDLIFGSLSHPIRRDILRRAAETQEELSVSDLAKPYKRKVTLAAISKHLKVLEKAKLIIKRRRGKEQVIQISPAAIQDATKYLQEYERMWNQRLDALELYLSSIQNHDRKN